MEVLTFFTCVAVISVSGQFLDAEYRLDSVPLNLRRKPSSAAYDIQPSISREIEYQGGGTARVSSQGRRHIDNHQNIQNGNNNVNDNFYKNDNKFIQPTYNNEQQVNYDDKQSARLQQHNHENYVRESSVLHTNRDAENRDQNDDRVIPLVYDKSVKTNLGNKHSHQNIQALPHQDNFNQNSYQSNNLRTNVDQIYQQTDPKPYENNGQNVLPTSTNSHNRHIVKASQTTDSYNYLSSSSERTNVNPTNQDVNRDYKYSESSGNSHRNTEAINGRSIDSISYDNRQAVDSSRYNNNKNSAGKLNGQNTDTRKGNKDRNYESTRESTEPSRRTTFENKLVTSGTKSTQDNELVTKMHTDGRSGSKFGSDGSETSTKTIISTTLPDVNDRAAFDGGKCPTGQVKINNMCVYKD